VENEMRAVVRNNSLLTAYTWLAMFVGQIGISVRKPDAFWPGIWFRCAAHFKTTFFPKESPMKIDISAIFSA